jgi:hypothetical protein
VPELPSDQDNLPAMMRFMGHEVRQDVAHIEWQVAPGVRWGRRHPALYLEAQCEERLNAFAAPPQGREQRTPADSPQIDEWWNVYSVGQT